MDTFLSFLNIGACGLISLALIGAILSPRVHDGIVIKIGLISLASGFGAMALRLAAQEPAGDIAGVLRALLLINSGITVVIIGYLLRISQHPGCVATDWGDLIDTDREGEHHANRK